MRVEAGTTRFACGALLLLAAPIGARAECPHPYMPWREGAVWVYSSGSGVGVGAVKETLTVRVKSVVRTDTGEQATLSSVLVRSSAGGASHETVLPEQAFACGANGISAPTPATEACSGSDCADRSRVRVHSKSGVLMPPSDALRRGFSWEDRFAYEVSPPAGSTATFSARGGSRSGGRENRRTVDQVEMVNTPLGQVEAIKVIDREKVVMPHQREPFVRTTVSWYARGVGMVRMIDGDRVTELVSFTMGR